MRNHYAFITAALIALLLAGMLRVYGTAGSLPVLGSLSMLSAVGLSIVVGFPALMFLVTKRIAPASPPKISAISIGQLLGLGALLAIPPVLIDIFTHFPEAMNLPLPDALFFYPSIALVAEVQFHLLPLAFLTHIVPRTVPRLWLFLPVILIEPLFQVIFMQGASLQSLLVLLNVTLISAVQLWLFRRHGFAAMIGLRLSFYLFWHVLWGTLRLQILF